MFPVNILQNRVEAFWQKLAQEGEVRHYGNWELRTENQERETALKTLTKKQERHGSPGFTDFNQRNPESRGALECPGLYEV